MRSKFSFGYTEFERFVSYVNADFIFHSKIVFTDPGEKKKKRRIIDFP